MISQQVFPATAIGYKAHQILETLRCAAVAGTSLRGIFVKHIWSSTLYLTREPYRGPYTINISCRSDIFPAIQPGERVKIDRDSLSFPDHSLKIDISKPLIWKSGPPPRPRTIRVDQIENLISRAKAIQPENAYLFLLGSAVAGAKPANPDQEGATYQLQPTISALSRMDYGALYSALTNLLGCGPGLTPLGDDLILGVLLAHSRTRSHLFWSGYDLFCQQMKAAAALTTTAISGDLICAALEGGADERLIRVLDGLIAGRQIPDNELDDLLTWGSSSGVAVLAGMLLVLQEIKSF